MFDTTPLRRQFDSVNELGKAVEQVLQQKHFTLHEPLVIRRAGDGPVFDVKHDTGHIVVNATDAEGRRVQLGIGLGSSGIVANELIPDPNYAIDPGLVHGLFSTQGNTPRDSDDSGFGQGISGSGRPHEKQPFVPRAGWAEAISNLQKSNDTEHAPGSAIKLTRDGQKAWWVTEPWKWQAVRCTVTTINADTLTCAVVANGNVTAETITVAKPCELQQTPYDGNSVGGFTYTYTDSQTRECEDDATYVTEGQEVFPAYINSGTCPIIYALWVGNQTDLSDVRWIDLNVAARHWVVA